MAMNLKLDEVRSLKEKVDEKASNLFRAKIGVPQLQVSRYRRTKIEDEKDGKVFFRNQELSDVSEIKKLGQDSQSSSEIFFVRQDRSWTTLNISRGLFEGLMSEYAIFPQFWKCMFTFGRKDHENEFEFPEFRARRTVYECNDEETFEAAYILRRVERHGRELAEGQSPWSIRQTAVYHRFGTESAPEGECKSILLLIAASPTLEDQLNGSFDFGTATGQAIFPWNVHRLLVADSLKNWMDYMAYLEDELREQSNRVLLAKVGTQKENLSPLTDFIINFVDRQDLKNLEDEVLDLQVILSTLLKTITRLRDHCKKCCQPLTMTKKETIQIELIMEEFDEYFREAETCLERGKVLQAKAHSTAGLLSDLLSYEEAVAMKDLTRETQLESKSMHHLTERSTKDAAAVKILTVITLIYLPTTIVANFFSTQFVETNDAGHMRLSNNAWLLAAIAIPLTVLTIALWGTWVYFTKVTPTSENEPPNTLPAILRRRQSSFKSILSSRKRRMSPPTAQYSSRLKSFFSAKKALPSSDLESGTADPEKMLPPGSPPTWSSAATTVKFE